METLRLLSTSATLLAASAISLTILMIGIRESKHHGDEKLINRTFFMRDLSFFSILLISFSGLLVLCINLVENISDKTLLRLASFSLFIGISLFILSTILLYYFSKGRGSKKNSQENFILRFFR